MNGDTEFGWDEENIGHLAKHNVKPVEFEQVMYNDPLDTDYQVTDDEERYRLVGTTAKGSILTIVWTPRGDKVRPVAAFDAGTTDKKAFREWERSR